LADYFATFAIGKISNRTRIDDVDVSSLLKRNFSITCIFKKPGYRGSLGIIKLAAKGIKSYGTRCRHIALYRFLKKCKDKVFTDVVLGTKLNQYDV
jgi:hypothetical protein